MRLCLSFEVTSIALADTPETRPGAGAGWNTIVAHLAEWPAVVALQDSNFLFVE